VTRGRGRPGSAEVAAADWIVRRDASNPLAVSVLQATLGAGEAACIILAAEIGADLLILDDRAARLHAEGLGLVVSGTVGVLLAVDARGMLEFPAALADLLATGFRLRPAER